ncbi:MAG: ABC-2 type transport system permease protein [Alteromonadaceae bacterium]|jgi:ABC-2 type transport system permease protein
MTLKRFYAIFKARNIEFLRDKAALGWNFFFPVLLVVGFAFVFSGDGRSMYKVGLMGEQSSEFSQTKYIQFIDYQTSHSAMDKVMLKLQQHSLDLLIDNDRKVYWINETSPKGYIVEKLLLQVEPGFTRQVTQGKEVRYVDFVLPGILGMNMMFSCLFGVGYVVVRYRKNSVLKRLQATPLHAAEFLCAQVFSRLLIVMGTVTIIYLGCNLFFDFYMIGSYLQLLLIAALGALAMISMGLVVAARSESEELVGGMLNMLSWPMMVLSGVWFSLEGAPEFIQTMAQFLPLTHLVDAARSIMTNGDTLWDLKYNVLSLLAMTVCFTSIGAWMFRWESEGR